MSEVSIAPVTVGVIGLGRAGWDIHIDRLRGDQRFRITAVSDLQEARRAEAEAEFGCDSFSDYGALLTRGNCELVVVASQSVDHGPHTIAALESGRHVVVEKPMAMNTAEADAMIAAAESARRRLFVHQNYRYAEDVRHIHEVMQSGLLGRVFEIRVRGLSFGRRNDWQTLKKFGGGTLNNTTSHYIDAAIMLLDSPLKRIFTDLQLTTDVGDADDHAKILLKAENGCLVDIEISTSCAFEEPKWTVLGTSGTLRSDGATSQIKYFDPLELAPLEVNEAPPSARQYGNDDVLPWREETRPSKGEATGDFYDNVFAVLREDAEQEITPQQVREVIRVLETAHRENPPL